MQWGRIATYRERIRAELQSAFREHHTPKQVAGSFSLGLFITALPTLGTGLILFVIIITLVDRVSKIALFASVLVLNPVVKWGVYLSSFWIGSLILGPVSNTSVTTISYSAGPAIVTRLLLGNFILAFIFSIIGYVVVLRLVTRFRERDVDVIDYLPDVIVEHAPVPDHDHS